MSPQSRCKGKKIVQVAVFAPLRSTFDYVFESDNDQNLNIKIGARVRVSLRNSKRIGIVVSFSRSDVTCERKLKNILEVIDNKPIVSRKMLALASWAASYYHHPIGEVISLILPSKLRKGDRIPSSKSYIWSASQAGRDALEAGTVNGARQLELLQFLASNPNNGLEIFRSLTFAWQVPLKKLVEKGWATKTVSTVTDVEAISSKSKIILNSEQLNAKSIIERNLGKFCPSVLYGVTGSGKTEVYFEVMQTVISAGKQVLFLLPEIALTKHLISRFRERFGSQIALLHSARSNSERVSAWQDCLGGKVSILLGTRSAVWFDLPNLGMIVVDEEHDSAYKQYDGFKYSARDIAVVRAKRNNIPIILGSATPSFETLANIKSGKYNLIKLMNRPSALVDTRTKILDVRGSSLKSGLSNILIERMRHHLDLGQQVVLFLNRRGYAPLLICRECGDIRSCHRCDAYLVYYKSHEILSCHHCGYKISLEKIPKCCEDQNMAPIGLGTESIEEEVRQLFPEKNVVRVDRDSIKSGDSFEIILRNIEEKQVDIVIGTQMISKGLDFENVTLVGVIDADSRLYSIDFRAEERLAQLLIQVTGRAGRGGKAGEMVLQTHRPDNPVLRRIIDEGYEAYSDTALAERELAQLPPYVSMVIIRAESQRISRPKSFLLGVKKLLEKNSGGKLKITDPIPALMAQRAGRHRYLLVIRMMKKSDIHDCIGSTILDIENLARKIKLRWAIDVDPHDTL